MNSIEVDASTADSILAILEGGPATLPEASRVQAVRPFIHKIKVEHYGGYEHFVRIEEFEECLAGNGIVFRWTMRTEIAE